MRTEFPRTVEMIPHVWIPLKDGTRLSARIWLPEDARQNPVPAILEYLPYRKNDSTAIRDSKRHPYFAGHGYASVRVDMRGSGDSDGLLMGEYLPQEQDDALEILEWLAAQPWCTGAVGMFGKSWGGFNGLQVAARRPPQLKAVISLYSTDDRYADDVHYGGGCVLGLEVLSWATTMLAYNGRPPDPAVVGDEWRSTWLKRLEQTPPYIESWLSHQRRDSFWKQGSVCDHYSDITCPVYMIGGWADPYTNAVFRTLAGLSGPRKGLVGPWGHEYPDEALPGPQIGFLQECLRWWDQWLKDSETGIMDEPMLKVWLPESRPASGYVETWPGRWVTEPSWPARWVTEPSWPAPGPGPSTWYLNPRSLDQTPAEGERLTLVGAQQAGLDSGIWCPHGAPGELPPDQRGEDGLWWSFTSAPLAENLTILGFPEVLLTLVSDQPRALLSVRLCDVSPTGASTLMSRGVLNLTHRNGHEHPEPLVPGLTYEVKVRCNAVGYTLLKGHRLRIAVSPTDWPTAWPSPVPVTLSLEAGAGCRLTLPVRPEGQDDGAGPAFEPAETAPAIPVELVRAGGSEVVKRTEVISGRHEIRYLSDGGVVRLPGGLEYGSHSLDLFAITEADPLSAETRAERTVSVARDGWSTRVEAVAAMTADAGHFYVESELRAYESDSLIFSRTWHFKVPRDLQ